MADAKYLQGFKSNPNQTYYEKNPIPKGKKGDKESVFATINCNSMALAMKDLSNAEFKVWCYLAKNQPGYLLAISPADALKWGGISKDTFQKAIRVLKEKNYLVLKEGTTNSYIFYETPYEEEEEEIFVEKAPPAGFHF